MMPAFIRYSENLDLFQFPLNIVTFIICETQGHDEVGGKIIRVQNS